MRWLTTGALGGSAVALGCGQRTEHSSTANLTPETEALGRGIKPDFTVAFLTDPHVFPKKGAPEGCARAFQHALDQGQKPELIITGGDLTFDLLEADHEAAKTQLDLFDQATRPVDIPMYHTLGNHDLFGLYQASGISTDDPLYGKAYFLNHFGLERTYYSFDHEGWHFVVLDTLGIQGTSYRGWVDAEQLAWLDDDLAHAGKPTVVVGHIPLFSNYIEWKRGTSQGIPEGVTVVNSHEVAKILEQHAVKLVLAGHLHVNEAFYYKGIAFANIGAIAGNWWDGLRDGFQEGYAILEFRGDEVRWDYIDYGWEHRGVVTGAE
jgi:3',5'-cyclic AMP phosphodiesterase CpdA